MEEPIRAVDLLDGSKAADDATILPTAETGFASDGRSGVFQTEERDDGLGCKGEDKRWMPPGVAQMPMLWATPPQTFARTWGVGGEERGGEGGRKGEDKTWRPPG